MEKKYCQCTACVMDNMGDDRIVFDENGVCNYCKNAIANIKKQKEQQFGKVEQMIAQIKKDCKNDKYDCIMGISGGIDSSYVLYLGHKFGLRILTVHVDDGFDTEISRENLEKLVAVCGCDYHVVKPDHDQFVDLTKTYMKSGIKNIAAPQDNCLFTEIYRLARQYKIKYFITGLNSATECVSGSDGFSVYDTVLMKDIRKKFGCGPVNKLHYSSSWDMLKNWRSTKLKTVPILNYLDYNVQTAFEELQEFCGFSYYGRKHLENTLTAFIQLRWYPEKHAVDKRKWHLSSMIVSGQRTREEALRELEQAIGAPEELQEITRITAQKLDMTVEELEALLMAPAHSHTEYKTSKLLDRYWAVLRMLSKIKHAIIK